MDTHGPLFVVAGVLILAGIQMLAIGLLGELQVRHYHTSSQRAPYAIDRLVRLRAPKNPACCKRAKRRVGKDTMTISTKGSRNCRSLGFLMTPGLKRRQPHQQGRLRMPPAT